MDVPALTINKVCLSGLDAIALADQLIRAGEFDIVVAGGMESMTNAPHLLPKSREGYKYGDVTMRRPHGLRRPVLTPSTRSPMGESTEQYNARSGSPARSRTRSRRGRTSGRPPPPKNGLFDEEIAPVEIPQRKGDPVVVREDEGIRGDTTAESLGKLRPAFAQDGTITAGSASQISDGAAAVVVMSKAKAEELGLTWLAEIGAHGIVAGPDTSLHVAAGQRHQRRAAQGGLDVRRPRPHRDQRGVRGGRRRSRRATSASTEDIVNVNGGAIALGHPIGMSGARLVAARWRWS